MIRPARVGAAAAAVVGLAVLAASPVAAAAKKPPKVGKNMVGANSVDSVIRYLRSKGDTVEQSVDEAGAPLLTESNNYYVVNFLCEEGGTGCTAIQLSAYYSDYPGVTVDATNALSRDFYFPKSYIDADGNACIQLPVGTGLKGISYEAMDVSYDAFTAFTETTDEAFGTPPPE